MEITLTLPYYKNKYYLTKIHHIMIKRTGMIAITIFFIGTLATSCSKSHNICPAYTMNYKLEKIQNLKKTSSINQQSIYNSY